MKCMLLKKAPMRMKTINRVTAFALTAAMCAAFCLPCVFAEDTISIKSADDFYDFARKCKVDTWSQGKTVYLENDIVLSEAEFSPVPTFGGKFCGNGYTLSGVNISVKGSNQGLFRYLQPDGVIEELNVSGTVAPDGTKKNIGGIVGENSGTIQNCTFNGTVSGKTNIGGIAGYVTETGKVTGSKFSGSVTGDSYSGGVAGQNYGTLDGCENNGNINTTDNEQEKTIQDVQIDNIDDIRNPENIDTCTDTGGIAGFSKGTIKNCTNNGGVGFKSLGYNTGGIVGRQSGYIFGCTNNGTVYGRKDVGGIVGQAEPYILLEYTKDTIEQLDGVLDGIRDILGKQELLSDNALSDVLDKINGKMGSVTDSLDSLSSDVTDYADGVSGSVDELTNRLYDALNDSAAPIDMISDGTGKMSDGIGGFRESGDYLKAMVDDMKNASDAASGAGDDISDTTHFLAQTFDEIKAACDLLNDSVSDMDYGMKKLKKAAELLRDAVDDKEEAEKLIKEILDSVGSIQKGTDKSGQALEDAASSLEALKDRGLIGNDHKISDLIRYIKYLALAYRELASSLQYISDALLILVEDFNVTTIRGAINTLSNGFDNMAKAVRSLEKSGDKLKAALDELDGLPDSASSAVSSMQTGLSHLQDGTKVISDSIDRLSGIVTDFKNKEKIKLPSASDIFGGDFDSFFDGVDDIQSEFSNLGDVLKDKKSSLSSELDSLNDELGSLTSILSDAYDDHVKDSDVKDEIYEDVSDKELYGDTRGKVARSVNNGEVTADINGGGIVGSMAIEYDFDPEDDIKNKGDKSLKFTYKTMCVVLRCKNDGAVNLKKNYGGGVVGRMDLGSILLCENYGDVANDDGSYTGGIAGMSDTVIRNSAVKCGLSGGDYIGGVAGKADTVSGSYTLVNISDSGEFAGAVAGDADKDKLSNNFFVSDTWGGIDDITYTGAAENTDIDNFVRYAKASYGTDIVFELVFMADDKEISRLNFNYKDKIPEEQIPAVPEKSGYYGKWSSYNFDEATHDAVINAEYYRDISLVESSLTRDNGKPVFLLCGAFDDNARISAGAAKEPEMKNAIDAYDVEISGAYNDKHIVRYLPQEKNSRVYIQSSGAKPHQLNTKKFGSYLEFETTEKSFTIYETKMNYLSLVLIICIAVGVLAAAAVVIKKKSVKRRRK